MTTARHSLRALIFGIASIALALCVTIPSQAATKTQTRTQAGPGCAIKATMTFQLSNGIVSNGR